jgi:PIN domain nuclease of toxin-antitoxin system
VWELAIKVSLGKFRGDLDELLEALSTEGFSELPVLARHAVEVSALPLHHRDPFDRLLVAQSRVEALRLYTDDAALARYGEHVVLLG